MITKVALKLKTGKIVSMEKPARHHTIINSLPMGDAHGAIQGFINPYSGEFMDRKEAYSRADRTGQVLHNKYNWELFSEDLW